MFVDFVGRVAELASLRKHLEGVRHGAGRMLSVRGRRQVGKSRLISEFAQQANVPQLFVTGSRQASLAADLEAFRQDARLGSTLPGAELLSTTPYETWEQALRTLGAALPTDGPAIVVLDELPWLLERDRGLDGTLQKVWDRILEQRQILLILVGSDLSVMEMLTDHNRPLFGRAREMVVAPLHVGDTAHLGGIDLSEPGGSALAFDAFLLTGGYPRLVAEWRRTPTVEEFLAEQLADEGTDLVNIGQRVLDVEFPADLQASSVLRAIGAGERTFSAIATRCGISATSLTRALALLTDKRVIAVDEPVSLRPTPKLARYRVADPYLRFWLRFVEAGIADIRRGRPDLALARLRRDWVSYRGRAVEPVVREALDRLSATDEVLGGAQRVGGWWPRSNNPEVDLVGVRPADRPNTVTFVGSVKWREDGAFDERDLAGLARHRSEVPGAEQAHLIAVTRTTCVARPDACYTPSDLLRAWGGPVS